MSGRYFGTLWSGGKKPVYLAQLWNIVFGRKRFPWDRPRAHHYAEAANVLRNLAESPFSCALLADALEIEIDAGESAADWVAQMALAESLKANATQAQMRADEAHAAAGSAP